MSKWMGRAASALQTAPVTAPGGRALPARGRVPEPMSSFAKSSAIPATRLLHNHYGRVKDLASCCITGFFKIS